MNARYLSPHAVLRLDRVRDDGSLDVEVRSALGARSRCHISCNDLRSLTAMRTSEHVNAPLAPDLVKRLSSDETLTVRRLETYMVEQPRLTSRHEHFFSYIRMDPRETQKRISHAHVMLVGLGGIGTWAAQHLVSGGVGRVTVVDPDTVESSNLSRQCLFEHADIGHPKVARAAERLRKINPECVVRDLQCRFADLDDDSLASERLDLVILSGDDSSNLSMEVDRISKNMNVPWIRSGYIKHLIVCGPLLVPGEGPCQTCIAAYAKSQSIFAGSEMDSAVDRFNRAAIPPSFGPINAIAASIAAKEVLLYLGGCGDRVETRGRLLLLDGLSFEKRLVRLDKVQPCGYCQFRGLS